MANDNSKQFLHNNQFRFTVNRLPNVEFFIQQASIPGLSVGQGNAASPYLTMPVPGDKVNYDPLNVTFKINEDLSNYIEIFDWLLLTTFTTNTQKQSLFSDATLHIMTNKGNLNKQIRFIDIFPFSLGEVLFDATTPQPLMQETTVTFAYKKFEFMR